MVLLSPRCIHNLLAHCLLLSLGNCLLLLVPQQGVEVSGTALDTTTALEAGQHIRP
jgi:hypothetical protein